MIGLRKSRLLGVAVALTWASGPVFAGTVAQDLQALQQTNAEIQLVAQNWPQIQQAAQAYGGLSTYAEQAGIGPVVTNSMNFREQCHNAYWDNEIPQLVTGSMNIAGDAEAQAYAMQAISTAWAQDIGNLLDDEATQDAQEQNPNFSNLQTEANQAVAAANALNSLLSAVGSQIAAALGPNTTLTQLPISNWQAGIGGYPNLSAVQWNAGPANGAPIGWYMDQLPVDDGLARLVDICPTGTASIPEESDASTLSAVQAAEQEEPELTQVIPAISGGSNWTAPEVFDPYFAADYQTRVQLVRALGYDMPQVAGYMAPVTGAMQSFAQTANQLTETLSEN